MASLTIPSSITVLLTGVGSPGAPGVIRSLRRVCDRKINIVGVDMNPLATGRSMVDRFEVVPVAQEQAFIDAVMTICRERQVNVVLPLVTGELAKFAAHAADFKDIGAVVSVSSPAALHKAIHKGRLFSVLQAAGMAVPRHQIARSGADLVRALGELGYPEQAVCFKPTMGDGGRGFRVIDPAADRVRSLFVEKPDSARLNYDEIEHLLAGVHAIPEVLVMEYLPGAEYSVDLLADHGKALVAIPRLREQTMGGVTTSGVICRDEDVIQYASTIVKELGLHGNIGVQVRRDRAGTVQIIEVNPRIQGTIVHCTAAGVNLPYLAVKLALGAAPMAQELDVQWGVHMQRYWAEVYRDADGRAYVLDAPCPPAT